MSVEKPNKNYTLFKSLSPLDRKLMALKILCCQYATWSGEEKRFIDALIQLKAVDDQGKLLTLAAYKASVKRLQVLKFANNKAELTIFERFHHPFLAWMSTSGFESEMQWIFSVVDVLYPNDGDNYQRIVEDRENAIKTRVQIKKALYANETAYFLAYQDNPLYGVKIVHYLQKIIDNPSEKLIIDIAWLRSRNPFIQLFISLIALKNYFCESPAAMNSAEIIHWFCEQNFESVRHDYLQYYCAIIYLSLGHVDKVLKHAEKISDPKSGMSLILQATTAFLLGQLDVADKLYPKALTGLRKQFDCRYYYFDNILGVYHSFYIAYVTKKPGQLEIYAESFRKYEALRRAMSMHYTYFLLQMIEPILRGDHLSSDTKMDEWLNEYKEANPEIDYYALPNVIYQFLQAIISKSYIQENADKIYVLAQAYTKNQQILITHILYELLEKTELYHQEAIAFLEKSSIRLRLLAFVEVKDAWEYSFQALEDLLLNSTAHSVDSPMRMKRLLWLLDPDNAVIDVIEQTLGKSGKWSAGRAVSVSKLREHHLYEQFNYLEAADKEVLKCIVRDHRSWYDAYEWDDRRAILALVGNQNIAHYQNRETAITLTRGEPELHIEETSQGYHLSLSHYLHDVGLILEPESMNQYRVIDFSKEFVNISQILTKKGLVIPVMAKEKVLNVIQNAKRDIKIHVELQDSNIPEIAGDSTPCLQILPVKQGIKITLWVKPVMDHGTYCKAGQGKKSVTLMLEENRTRILRNLPLEKENQEALLQHCPGLTTYENEGGEYEMETPEETLEVLSELLHYATENPIAMEWPQGQTFKIKQQLFGKSLSMKISSNNNWFSYDGEVKLNDGEIISMKELLEALDNSSHGRFVRLGSGDFIELTHHLKKQLSLLKSISEGNQVNALGAQALSDIVEDAENTVFDAGWEAHLQKIKTMKTYTPKVPSTLQATLRDYQIEGFQHLSRLTHWGIGACLADDMGLGKTVQAIALLLERAKQGASLVVAPTSVGFNWMAELEKFAPTLKVHALRSSERATLISKAGKFDVIICSYGLLHHNEALLVGKQWETIILDEAQAIKNAHTKRWKTVMKLKGNNRIALSGTPIENHLGELWSLFSFINPGLLGSVQSFQNKYSTPIENGQSPDKVLALKTLVSPYILRRIKSDVLTELPPKTEQTIYVEPSKEEVVFYEALRQKAEARMMSLMEAKNRLGVLAEITKLRLACCDSSLVDDALSIENSKINLFIDMVKNILDNGHKTLVFSQYVSFLAIIKKRIEAENISHQYLDGSTSPANRKKSVDAFQNGEGDVFLLSLKAGGSGLNLTAADYVIHLDPWWNPAVEDQASDRAHRIGQERPVTIYRFVMKNTIEEKIISLHEHKRNLANELLSGQSVSGKLSNEDLMNLIYSEKQG